MDLQRKAAGSVLFSGECTVHQSEGGCGPKDINNIYIYIIIGTSVVVVVLVLMALAKNKTVQKHNNDNNNNGKSTLDEPLQTSFEYVREDWLFMSILP